MTEIADRIEAALSYGGLKKDIAFLIISAISLVLSFFSIPGLPFNPAWIAVILCGIPILIESATGLFLRFDIKADVLVSIALIASLYIGEIFAAGEVALIMVLGALLEDYTSERARRGISKLMGMIPETARVIRNGKESIIHAKDVRIGDTIKVIAGESIPVDGVIISGTTSIDQSMMTGESIPVDKAEGDEVMSGTVNRFGVFTMRATKEENDSSMERMIRLMEDADADKAPIVRQADRWASWIVLIALTISFITYIFTKDIVRAVTVLVVFCPCAFILATPTAVAAAIGNSSRRGMLVRSGAVMENLSRIDKVTFDKTGTLTYGTPTVSMVKSVSSFTDDEIFRLCASAEIESEHPLGKAIVASYDGETYVPEGFAMMPGKGVSCTVNGISILTGNRRLMEESGIDLSPVDGLIQEGETAILVAADGILSGYIVLEDRMKYGCEGTVKALSDIGVEPILMTGDNEYSAKRISAMAGITHVVHDCLPEDKMANIERLQSEGSRVCMVGDGVNDAPALKKADVGISMGGIGSDMAIEASDITLVNDDIGNLPHLFMLSRRMMRVININITLSMIINFSAIALAVAGVLNPVSGALVHNAGSVMVVILSAMLLGWRSKKAGIEKDRAPRTGTEDVSAADKPSLELS